MTSKAIGYVTNRNSSKVEEARALRRGMSYDSTWVAQVGVEI